MTRAERRHASLMRRGVGQPVALVAGQARSAGEVRVERWGRPARLGRAVRRCAVMWGLAVLSVLLPGLHFVLVPAFLLAGPIAAFARYRQTSGVLGGDGRCPACGAPLAIDARPDEWPFFEACQACRASVRFEKA